ncbi:TPM domain-containing protein [Paenibacillus sp. 1P07SE]|uniref:TPM domain-containing protein n=1 Tax=Paenibacillus sp. 1P07SE TaxID=3132209 RepID=UPI0039A72081
MKTLRVGLAVWVLCAFLLGIGRLDVAVASGLPDNLGPLQDRAGFFTAEQKAEIKQEIADMQHLGVYVLTVASLNGRDVADYATSIYDHWGLSARDVLLLISEQERRIELNFNNPALHEAIDTAIAERVILETSETGLTGLLNATFIPHAREGDFQQAIQQTIQVLDQIGERIAPEAPAVQTEEVASGPAAPPVQEKKPSEPFNWGPFKSFMGKVFTVLWNIVLWTAIAIVVIALIRRCFKGLSLFKKIASARKESGNYMVEISRALERLSPLAEMSQGRTSRVAKELERNLTDMLVVAENASREDHGALHILQLTKLKDLLSRVTHEVETLKKYGETALPSAHDLADLEQEVPRTIERLRGELQNGRAVYEELAAQLAGPIEPLLRDMRELEELLGKAQEQAVFDVIEAREWTGRAERQMAALGSNLQELLEHARHHQTYPEREREARQYVKHVIEEHNLYTREQEIYRIIDESRAQVPMLQEALRRAETIRARSAWQRIEQQLSQARDRANQLAEFQRSNNEKTAVLEETLQGLELLASRLEQEFFRLSNDFKKTLWSSLEQKFHGLQRELATAHAEMEKAKERQTRQQFGKAKEILDDLAVGAKKLSKELTACENGIIKLDMDRKTCVEQFASDREIYEELLSEIESSDVIILPEAGMEEDFRLTEEVAQRFREAESGWPCDLHHLQKQAALHREAIAQTREKFETIQHKKELATTTLDRYSVLFYRIVDQTTGIFYKMGRKREFRKLHDEIYELIESGHYDDALEECGYLKAFIDPVAGRAEMANRKRQYEQEQRQIRSEARARARAEAEAREAARVVHHHHHHNKPSSSSSGSFLDFLSSGSSSAGSSSSRSSSSSSSRSSSHSSGGSSWSSSSSPSSGGSSWSDSSSRSSGGSSFGGSSTGGGNSKGQSSGGSNW